MKKITINNKFIIALLMLFSIIACDDRELVTVDNQSSPIVADLSVTDLFLDENFPNNPALTLHWEVAAYSVPVSINYKIEISATESFENPVELSTVVSSKNYITFTTTEMNKAAKNIGLVADVAQKMYFRVTSYLGDGELSAVSNITYVTITPYVSSPTYTYTDLYLIGSSTPAAWDNTTDNINLIPLLKSTTSTSVYTYTGYFKASGTDGGFKIIKTKGSWDVQYGLGSSSGLLSNDGGSGNIPVPSDGYYKVTINISTLVYTLVAVDDPATTYNSISLIGTINGNWDTDTQLTQSSFDPHLWILGSASLSAGEFKFRANNAWDVSWGSSAEYFGTATVGGDNIPLTAEWTYNVYFNDITGDYTIIPVE